MPVQMVFPVEALATLAAAEHSGNWKILRVGIGQAIWVFIGNRSSEKLTFKVTFKILINNY